ncbi:hypothetical protein DYB28_015978 [Aphanomyces astaci]|uniref:Uncharacterized protein n=1 Tax=Aphanomyces astaci TaxID=112090 RepID=A0A9X8H5F8_APHAT|nr:hypothetical protein DYB28_015978 [Aphanomyces astaci]
MLVNTVERPRFADGYTSIVGNKSVPFHPADVLHWRSGRQAFVLPTVPEERSAARQPPPRLRSREARSSATTDAGFWAGVLNPSCWSLMSPQTTTLPDENDPIDLDMLVNTVERPRFADGYTSIVGNKSVPFHPADVLHWRSGRQAFVLATCFVVASSRLLRSSLFSTLCFTDKT